MGLAKLLEQVRLRAHFRQVIAELRARDVSELAAPERAMRDQLIVELARYARRGVFPRNVDFATRRMPYFVDASGTRCAMAHLIDATGERAYVDRVRDARNNGYVRELANDARLRVPLVAWLQAAGLTAAEAARIQPAYCFETKANACFCNYTQPSDGVVIVTVTDQTLDNMVARIDALHGNTGALAIGESITLSAAGAGAHPGDALLVPLRPSGEGTSMFQFPFRLDGNEVILDQCDADVPVLTKTDAIAAVMAANDSCDAYLAMRDSTWGESQCEEGTNDDDSGCAITSAASPLAIGAALAAALWTRRRPASARR
jgi:hypothetical protein